MEKAKFEQKDHSIIELHNFYTTEKKFCRGPRTWKFNKSLRKNKLHAELINNTIEETIVEYSAPIYNPLKIHEIPQMYLP